MKTLKLDGDKSLSCLLIGLAIFSLVDNVINFDVKRFEFFYIVDYFVSNVVILGIGIASLKFKQIINYSLFALSIISVYTFYYEIPISEILAGYSICVIAFNSKNPKFRLLILSTIYLSSAALIGALKEDPQDVILSRAIITAIVTLLIYLNHFSHYRISGFEIFESEIRLCKMIEDGMAEKEIASELNISKSSVTKMIKQIRDRAGVSTTSDLRVLLVKKRNN